MKLIAMIETIQQMFPDIGTTQILLELNKAKDELCHESKLITTHTTITGQNATKRYYPLTLSNDISDVDDVIEINSVDLDANDNEGFKVIDRITGAWESKDETEAS